ncbi:hypothetical protein CISG_05863 [Coccidioides immitis RMSCC 3703]|uniref:Uncharacterized protein n=2 Tax=Coccidioides immitis TaxID=5501 RepID=A0A0J8QXF6_COCIT|nr:hypothetical protein CIRG_10275 [Coccidioides immitis RMSCC 2394]KMU76720.1 hypothetical protein CISG_05863 [Coccidioides immitis RMSCC 3703]
MPPTTRDRRQPACHSAISTVSLIPLSPTLSSPSLFVRVTDRLVTTITTRGEQRSINLRSRRDCWLVVNYSKTKQWFSHFPRRISSVTLRHVQSLDSSHRGDGDGDGDDGSEHPVGPKSPSQIVGITLSSSSAMQV